MSVTHETEELCLSGKATDHIWGMVHEIDGVEYIGLRVDCGDSGTLYLTVSQAHDVIDNLNALLGQLSQLHAK